MKNNKTLWNVASGIILQLSVALTGILIPKLVLQYYGSALNGLTVSISQLISYVALVESGIGAVGIVALYAPIVNGDHKQINATISAISRLYQKSGLIYLGIVGVAGFLYPFLISGQVDRSLTTGLFFVLSASNLVDYLFLGRYKVLLTSDERLYIVNGLMAIGNVINVVLSYVSIVNGASLIFVKLISVALCVARLVVTYIYVKKHYTYISLHDEPDYSGLGARWASLVHQIAAVVVGNTDVLLLTIMLGSESLLEVSVYSTYNMVLLTIGGVFGALSSGVQAHLGKLYISDKIKLAFHFSYIEKLIFGVIAIAFSCSFVLILDFVTLYTEGVHDVNYYRPMVGMIFVFNGIIQNMRIPGVTLICAAGKYRETRNKAILEAVINIAVSVILIPFIGIIGALLGTTVSYLYRTTDVIVYSNKLLEGYPLLKSVKGIFVTLISIVINCLIMLAVNNAIDITGWLGWIGVACIDLAISLCVVLLVMVVGFKDIREFIVVRLKKRGG